MTNSVAKVAQGRPQVAGAIFNGPLGTTLPTDSTTALDAALKSMGYAGDAGLVETPTRTTDPKKAWGGDTIKVTQTDYQKTFAFTMVEARNTDVQKAVYGADNVTITAPTSSSGTLYALKDTGDPLPHGVWVFDMLDGDGTERIVVEDGQITDIGAINYTDADIIAYPVTLTAFRGATLGAFSVKYGDDGITTA